VLFVKYLAGIKIYSLLERYFGKIRKSKKRCEHHGGFKHLLCFFRGTWDKFRYYKENKKRSIYVKYFFLIIHEYSNFSFTEKF